VIGHRTANYLNHIACRELSSRGFLALCFNTRFQNNETQVRWEETPLDVKAAVEFVRRQPGITKVILFGHSGGGPLMSFYQAVAGTWSGVLSKAGAAGEMRRRSPRAAAGGCDRLRRRARGKPRAGVAQLEPRR
jgi:predicted alpha/beta-fold hydrolase